MRNEASVAKTADESGLNEIEGLVRGHPEGMGAQQIADALDAPPPRRTLQYHLKQLVDAGRLVMQGERRWARYHAATQDEPPARRGGLAEENEPATTGLPLSAAAASIQAHVRQPLTRRKPVGYDRDFLESYRPGRSFYLTARERTHLRALGTQGAAEQPAGTYARQIMSRLLIDLSWNSSRLEGNTYSLLDTRRLIAFGEEAAGKRRLEAQMILNHKDAIEFLVDAADEIGFDRHTVLNLHGLLANNLLDDPAAPGRLRRMPVGIAGSTFHPLAAPQLIEECFGRFLATASAIRDPFEQAFFAMVQLPYLQPFDDVNKRVSRLAANIPLIRGNLIPLSFDGVPQQTYAEAVLGLYELRRPDMLKELFIWAYERSAARYAAVRQSLGEPDPFRIRHRAALIDVIGEVVRGAMDRKQAAVRIRTWTQLHIERRERELFREMAEGELLALHEGSFARYRIRPAEFAAWRRVWDPK